MSNETAFIQVSSPTEMLLSNWAFDWAPRCDTAVSLLSTLFCAKAQPPLCLTFLKLLRLPSPTRLRLEMWGSPVVKKVVHNPLREQWKILTVQDSISQNHSCWLQVGCNFVAHFVAHCQTTLVAIWLAIMLLGDRRQFYFLSLYMLLCCSMPSCLFLFVISQERSPMNLQSQRYGVFHCYIKSVSVCTILSRVILVAVKALFMCS